jgi:phosphohistidine phosphatase SixA
MYLVRHGDAVGRLTEKGEQQIECTAKKIRKELGGIKEIVIYSSPKERAKQSAELIAEILLPIRAYIKIKKELDCSAERIMDLFYRIDSFPTIIVSHKPDLESFLENEGINYSFENGGCKKIKKK